MTRSRARGWAQLLQDHWWRPRPSLLARALQPLSWLYQAAYRMQRMATTPQRAMVPVLVVGNCVVGGAGKTPTVLAVLRLLQAAGHRPAVLSRGYGRVGAEPRQVLQGDTPDLVGDEPLLIHRRSGVPVWVGPDRAALATLACRQQPDIDVLVCDDGLQHHRLARDVNLVVFDERGTGNGLLLPAGPLRQPLPAEALHHQTGAMTRVLYNAPVPSTSLPGTMAQRQITTAWPLDAWWHAWGHARGGGASAQAVPLESLRGRELLAVAGLAAPEKFFNMLESAGLQIKRLPLPDHHPFNGLPWPGNTAEVVTTEKDAIKLHAALGGRTRVWVVPLDFSLPEALAQELIDALFPPLPPAKPTTP